ncbi:MAG: 16S rRNA (cytosine(1402)-N(4))-methyltransferase RsmH [Betaproteobacteria bacterium]|nr:16S rRNA (cytosine(1402)-N(4))-methyltransferase RsmH [Betaproteobacteria bacterium]
MPAHSFSHRPVLLDEALAGLNLAGAHTRAAGTFVDLTFGRGGHSRAILARLGPAGRLVALDRDPEAVAAAASITDPRFSIHHAPFSEFGRVLDGLGIGVVQGVLADLGVSSPQLDDPARGFSLRGDGPLDMRMDPTRGVSAADWIATASEQQLAEAIAGYGEERFAKQVAKAIVAAREREPLLRTQELAAVVAAAVLRREARREAGQNPATRTFQALRILVNRELEEVALMLPQALARLAAGGRLAVISFHSLEGRLVKRALRAGSAADELPRDWPVRARDLPEPALRIIGRAHQPSAAEAASNPRARSARLRIAERTGAPLDVAALARRMSIDRGPDAWRS